MITIYFGVELECGLNTSKVGNISVGDYHSGNVFSRYWKAEHDGSLYLEKWRGNEAIAVEFVSHKFKEADVDKVLNNFRKEIFKRAGKKLELDEVLDLNSSCGLHIHFSHPAVDSMFFIHPLFYRKVRKKFVKDLREKFPDLYGSVMKHYFRRYAKRAWANFYSDRYSEFNLTDNENGLEWRSINALGAKKWSELFGIIKLAIGALLFAYDCGVKNKFLVKNRISFKSEDMEDRELADGQLIVDVDRQLLHDDLVIDNDGDDDNPRSVSEDWLTDYENWMRLFRH